MQSRAETYLTGQEVLQGLDIVPVNDTTPLTFRSLGGEEFTLNVGTAPASLYSVPKGNGFVPDYLQNSSAYYWYTYSASNRLLYFKYNSCEDDPKQPFALNTLDTNPVDTFVIDFRGNGGGSDGVIFPLGIGLFDRFQRLTANPRFRLYLAIDKGTFSAAKDDAEYFKSTYMEQTAGVHADMSRVFLIGAPTGGKPAEYSNVQGVHAAGIRSHGAVLHEVRLSPGRHSGGPGARPRYCR